MNEPPRPSAADGVSGRPYRLPLALIGGSPCLGLSLVLWPLTGQH